MFGEAVGVTTQIHSINIHIRPNSICTYEMLVLEELLSNTWLNFLYFLVELLVQFLLSGTSPVLILFTAVQLISPRCSVLLYSLIERCCAPAYKGDTKDDTSKLSIFLHRDRSVSASVTLEYVRQFLHTKYAPSNFLRNHKIIFYLKFLNFTVKIGQNKDKIDDVKIVINLLAELKLRLKRYFTRK